MTKQEFERQLRERFGHVPQPRIADDLDGLDAVTLGELLPDYFRAAMGGAQARSVHPLLPAIHRERLSLGELRERSAITSSDLGAAMGTALSTLLLTRWSNLTTDISRIARVMPAANFHPQSNVHVGFSEPAEVPGDGELPRVQVTITEGESGILKTIGGKFAFGRRVWQTFGAELGNAVLNYADAFSSLELKWIAETLEAGTLDTVSGQSLTVAGLSAAAAALRDSVNGAGLKSNLPIFALVVPSALEATAAVLTAALRGYPPHIVVNAHLSSATTWYAVANPALAPKLLRYVLRGAGEPRVFSNLRDAEKAEFAVVHDVAFSLAGGPGILKVST